MLRRKHRSAFLAAVQQLDGNITAVQDKYPRDHPEKGYTTGRMQRGAVQLAPPRDGVLGLTEGVEDALSVIQMFGVPTWAVIGTRLESVALPADVKRVFLPATTASRVATQLSVRVWNIIRDQRWKSGGRMKASTGMLCYCEEKMDDNIQGGGGARIEVFEPREYSRLKFVPVT